MHLLVIEDDPKLQQMLQRLLGGDQHIVELADDASSGIELAQDVPGIEAVILDVGLPDRSGFEVAAELRRRGNRVPILMLTARDTIGDRVSGLDAGADDYLVKPFAYAELVARLRALARRSNGAPVLAGTRLVIGPITLDDGRREVSVDGRRIQLTPREFSLLEFLMRHPGQALTRDQLLDHAWPFGSFLTTNAVDAYVHYLRDKLGPPAARRIETVRGVGYRMADG
ncbi:MAG: response regulator transcription factor [Chloroflexi bacterium]|nr:response regulator transcription factor [Chloroflexota bacterium]